MPGTLCFMQVNPVPFLRGGTAFLLNPRRDICRNVLKRVVSGRVRRR